NGHLPLLHTHSPLVDRSISSQRERRDSKPEKTDNRASHAGLQTDPVSVHHCAMYSGKILAAATALPSPLKIVQTERKVLQNTRALRVWSVLPTVTCNALASDPPQHALRATMPGCCRAPGRDSRPLWASLSDWQHRSGLLQTRAAATSHCANDVETVLRRGDRYVCLALGSAGRQPQPPLLYAALLQSGARKYARAAWPIPGPVFRHLRRPVPAPRVQAEALVLRAAGE